MCISVDNFIIALERALPCSLRHLNAEGSEVTSRTHHVQIAGY